MELERVLVVERNRNPYKEFLFLENAVSRIDSSPINTQKHGGYRQWSLPGNDGTVRANATIVSGWNVFHISWYYLGKTPAGVPLIWVNSRGGSLSLIQRVSVRILRRKPALTATDSMCTSRCRVASSMRSNSYRGFK
jgi:hypothetical protein